MTAPRVRVSDEIAWATSQLAEVGVASPRADAEWLMCYVLRIDRGRLLIADDLSDDQAWSYRDLVARRRTRVPLQHLIGTAAFGPVDLAVGPGVFVPRQETEWLLEWAVAALTEVAHPVVVDLCSGSGALGIAVATLVPTARVLAVEKSADSWQWLNRNITACDVASRCRAVCADVTDAGATVAALAAVAGSGPGSRGAAPVADLVVSNPPYVPEGTGVAPEVGADPHAAVFAGDDGMSVITPMLALVGRLLRPGGRAGIEHDESTSARVLAAAAATGLFTEVAGHDDLTGRPRFVTMRRSR